MVVLLGGGLVPGGAVGVVMPDPVVWPGAGVVAVSLVGVEEETRAVLAVVLLVTRPKKTT